jgi:hypothetical protein
MSVYIYMLMSDIFMSLEISSRLISKGYIHIMLMLSKGCHVTPAGMVQIM